MTLHRSIHPGNFSRIEIAWDERPGGDREVFSAAFSTIISKPGANLSDERHEAEDTTPKDEP
jgi:hypothetical protein